MKTRVEYHWIDGSYGWPSALISVWTIVFALIAWSRYQAGDILPLVFAIFFFFIANYVALASFVNRTVLLVSPTELEIRHEPVPWFGERTLGISDIESFSFRKWSWGLTRGSIRYKFYCNLAGKKRVNIFPGTTIVKPREATNAITRVQLAIEPFRKIDFAEDTREWLDC